jgi:hypothetical protein
VEGAGSSIKRRVRVPLPQVRQSVVGCRGGFGCRARRGGKRARQLSAGDSRRRSKSLAPNQSRHYGLRIARCSTSNAGKGVSVLVLVRRGRGGYY